MTPVSRKAELRWGTGPLWVKSECKTEREQHENSKNIKWKTCQKQCQERDPDSQQKALLFEIEYPEAQFGAHDGHGPETEPTCILKQ